MRVLNFGSLNIDYVYQVDHFVQPGETMSASSLQINCGGKGLNQSVALARGGLRPGMPAVSGRRGSSYGRGWPRPEWTPRLSGR